MRFNASNEIGLEVNADNSKYMDLSRDLNAGRIRSMKVDSICIEVLEEFKYLGTNLTNQNSIQEEMKGILKSENVCYHSVQNHLSSSFLSKNLKIKIYRTKILQLLYMGLKLGCWYLGRDVG